MQAAITKARMFNLVEKGGFSYEQLGIATIDGALPSQIIEEHLIIREIYYQALEDKRKV